MAKLVSSRFTVIEFKRLLQLISSWKIRVKLWEWYCSNHNRSCKYLIVKNVLCIIQSSKVSISTSGWSIVAEKSSSNVVCTLKKVDKKENEKEGRNWYNLNILRTKLHRIVLQRQKLTLIQILWMKVIFQPRYLLMLLFWDLEYA